MGTWGPLVGLSSADEGTVVERVIYRVVLDATHDAHEADRKASS